MKLSEAKALRKVIEGNAQATSTARTDDENIRVSVLYPDWEPGSHAVGEIYNAEGQIWECFQVYDNAVYPDIVPGNAAWFTFNRPLHGTSPETARPWVTPTGAHDIYRIGEYMVYTDGLTYRCKADTSFGPTDDPNAWEVEE